MRTYLLPFCLAFVLVACNSKTDISNFASEYVKPEIVFSINENDLIPEGITYDPQSKQFFVSSINKHKIVSINADGRYNNFIESDTDDMSRCLGLKVDVKRRRLWAVSNNKTEGKNVSFVHIYNTDTKKLIKKFTAPAEEIYMLNDLAITQDGGAYITDTRSGNLFTISPALDEIKLFMRDSLIVQPNGIALSPDNKLLYVASGTKGILVVDLVSKSIKPIGNIMSINTSGIDGMVYYKNNLIGVINEQYEFTYIFKYKLSADRREIIAASIIDKDNPLFHVPTTCVADGDNLFVLASTSLDILITKQMDKKELLRNPMVLKYNLNNL